MRGLPVPLPPRFLALGALLFAGALKGGPVLSRLPLDLTLLAGTALGGVLLLAWMRGARAASGWGLGLTGVWYLTFLPGAALAAPTAYAFQKVATLYSFSLLASLAPFVLVRDREDLRGLLNATAIFCMVLTADGLLGLGQGGQRLETAGGGTIALGRAAGFLFLFGALLLARPGPLSLPLLGLTGAAAVTAVFSGSRGPMGGALLALAVALGLGRRGTGAPASRLLLCAGAVALAVGLSLALAPPGSLQRTGSFLRGEFGTSERYRAVAARASWERLGGLPWGAGWGGFAAQVDLDGGTGRQYPHNLLLEVTLESGWACGALTTLVLGAGLGAAWTRSDRPEGRILLAGLVFWIVNALVSGDVNDNRPLFAFLSAALCQGAP
ncbi:O-antigen ligase family protein [Mesoterricola silvestris]|uniref:O-antigen ligase-related domain-containing protein n=1 Tax=Mesoterricola silvestris TaxID=2927979 RepID=A0AA48GT22_9BACT|nr:O-antigen ligase family protein [Mesoterricola silvestris]BDU71221.1 hypothetical protein METEAL_03950 [Mesoterricola silvestris]